MTHVPVTTIYLVHVPADGAPTIINRDLEGEIHEGLFRSWVRDAANAMLVELKQRKLEERV